MNDFHITHKNYALAVYAGANIAEATLMIIDKNCGIHVEQKITARSGKALHQLFCCLEYTNDPEFKIIIAYKSCFDELWSKAESLFEPIGAKGIRDEKPRFIFPSGAKIYFEGPQ